MDYLTRPVVYLDSNDFDDEGNIINTDIPKDKPVFIMIQANLTDMLPQTGLQLVYSMQHKRQLTQAILRLMYIIIGLLPQGSDLVWA